MFGLYEIRQMNESEARRRKSLAGSRASARTPLGKTPPTVPGLRPVTKKKS